MLSYPISHVTGNLGEKVFLPELHFSLCYFFQPFLQISFLGKKILILSFHFTKPKTQSQVVYILTLLKMLGSQVVLYSCCCCLVLSHVRLFGTPWTAAPQASLSFTISWSLPKLMSIKSVMLPKHLILCCPLLLLPSIFPSTRVFSNKLALCIRWPKNGASASASVLPMNIQG